MFSDCTSYENVWLKIPWTEVLHAFGYAAILMDRDAQTPLMVYVASEFDMLYHVPASFIAPLINIAKVWLKSVVMPLAAVGSPDVK